jgi:hypothetical protein
MLPTHIQDALDAILGDMNSDEADKKRKKYAPPEEASKPHHGVTITIVTGGKHPEPDGDEGGKDAEPLESPDELAKLLGGDEEEAEPGEEDKPEEEEEKRPKKKLRRY